MQVRFVLLLLCLLQGVTYAQTTELDSIERILIENKRNDTTRVNFLNRAAYKSFTSDLEKTFKYANEADSLSVLLNYAEGKAESMRMKGFYFEEKSDFTKALELYEGALLIFSERNNKTGMANCYNNVGIIYQILGDDPRSMDFFQKALKVYEEIGDKAGMANAFNNIGIIFHNQNDLDKALEYYWRSFEIAQQRGDVGGMANSYINIGIVYQDKEDYSLALEYYQKSLEIAEGKGDVNNIILNCINSGVVYTLVKDYSKASEIFSRGLELSKKVGSKSLEAWNYNGLGTIALEQNQNCLAYDYAKKAYSIAREIGEVEIIKVSSETLSKASASLGLFKDAYEYQIVFKTMSDSVKNEENTRKAVGLEFEYKYQKEKDLARLEQEKVQEIHTQELKHQKNIRNFFIAGFLMVLLGLALQYYNIMQKRKINRMLSEQRDEILMRNEELHQLNEEIRTQKEHIEKSHDQITQSITYAQLIQNAVLPNHEIVSMLFPKHFILYLPCEIVSGDFYFIKQVKQYTIIAAADCTGHGVPGAFMSMLGIALLNEIVRHTEIKTASQVLTELRSQLKRSLQQSGKDGEQPEGMDIAFCAINLENMMLSFAGAHNPCWIFRPKPNEGGKREHIVLEADRIPLGVSTIDKPFREQTFQLKKGDSIYLFTDGFHTQFGGDNEKKEKFQLKRLKSKLLALQGVDMQDQKSEIEKTFHEWKGECTQTDDVLVVGFNM